jgi:hypothetical protein
MNITRKKSRSRSKNVNVSIQKFNNIIEELGKSIISNTNSKNIELLKSIQYVKTSLKNSYIEEIMLEYPNITPEFVAKNISFIALIYQNKSIYPIIRKMINIKEETHNNYILTIIGSFFPEAEIVGGMDLVVRENNNNSTIENKKIRMFIPWFFLISLLSMLWVSYISYNQLFFIQHELEKNSAFSLVKDIGSAAMTCDFKNIHLSKEEESIFKIIKFANSKITFMDTFILENIEKTIKLRKCILDPKGTFETEVFNQNIKMGTGTRSSNNYQKQILNIDTNIVPSQLESKKVISQSLALVPSSTAAMLVPTETMQKYIMNYNEDLYNNIENKIRTDVEMIHDPTALINYFKKMENMDLRDFKSFFEDNTYLESDSAIPSMKDLKNILGIFGGETDSMFSLFIKGFSGMNIIDVVYNDYKKRMVMIHTELTIKSAQLNNYIENLIIDSSILITLLISFKTILCWFIFVALNFGIASYKMTKYIRDKMKKSKSKRNLISSTRKNKEKMDLLSLEN